MPERDNQEEEKGYTKVDRRIHAEDEEPTAAPEEDAAEEPQAPPEPEPAPAADEEPPPQDISEIGTFGILRFSVSLLTQQAWIDLGVQALPGKEVQQKLPEAKVAIDSLADLVSHLQPDLDESEKHELNSILANLRANYVQRAG